MHTHGTEVLELIRVPLRQVTLTNDSVVMVMLCSGATELGNAEVASMLLHWAVVSSAVLPFKSSIMLALTSRGKMVPPTIVLLGPANI